VKMPELREISTVIHGKKYQYYDIGRGSLTVVVLHGIAASKDWSLRSATSLEKDYRCICPDLPGHEGISMDGIDSLDDISVYIRDLIVHLSLKSVVLLGYSLGGMVAYTFERKYHGESWLKGIIVWASPLSGLDEASHFGKLLLAMIKFPETIYHALLSERVIKTFARIRKFTFPEEEMRPLMSFPHDVARKYVSMLTSAHCSMQFESPALFVYGTNDVLVNDSSYRYACSHRNDNTTVLQIEDGGHFVRPEIEKQVMDEIGDFIKGLENAQQEGTITTEVANFS